MSSHAHPTPLAGSKSGGIAARRAIVRWAGRMFRREWRQQLLVVVLLTVAVAAAIGSITLSSNALRPPYYELGSANLRLTFDASDPQKLQAGLDVAKRSFGTLDVIGHRSVRVPGGVETVDYRSQIPGGPFGGELLSLRSGSYPQGPGEVAVTNGVADLLRLEFGSTLALDGNRRTVVGIVENPMKLSEEFALVSPSSASPDYVDVLVAASPDSPAAQSFYEAPSDRDDSRSAFSGSIARGSDVSSTGEDLANLSVATVFLLLASLVAAAAFAVVAQRRLRQLGMLAAVGATQKHLRLVLLFNGAVVGAIAAVIGTIAGLALWVVFAPTLESAVDHRVDRLSLPWGLIALTIVLTVIGATAAAWWPGRAVARLPVVLALSGRPPTPRPARRSAMAAVALIAIGIACLALSGRDREPLIVTGILATIIGVLLFGPLAIRIFARTAGRAPVTARLALRDLARYQARSGAALAAITLALGIAAAFVVTASAEEKKDADQMAANLPNLSDRQIRVYLGTTQDPELVSLPLQTADERAQRAAGVGRMAASLGQATLTPLRKAVEPGMAPMVNFEGERSFVATGFARRDGPRHWTHGSGVYVATPALLAYLGVDPSSVDPKTDFLVDPTVPIGRLSILDPLTVKPSPIRNVQRIDSRQLLGSGGSDATDVPDSFVTLNGLKRLGWKQVPAGWLVESSRPLTSEQIAGARDLAADAGLMIETQHKRDSYAGPMAIATAAGAILALAILALTV